MKHTKRLLITTTGLAFALGMGVANSAEPVEYATTPSVGNEYEAPGGGEQPEVQYNPDENLQTEKEHSSEQGSIEPFSPESTTEESPENEKKPDRIHIFDERIRVKDTTKFPYSAIGAIFDSSGKAYCSASLIGPDTIATAAHCVTKDRVIKRDLVFCPGAYVPRNGWGFGSSSKDTELSGKPDALPSENQDAGEGKSTEFFGSSSPDRSSYRKPFGCSGAKQFWIDPEYYHSSRNSNNDLALVHLREPLGEKAGYLGIADDGRGYDGRRKIYISGYPGDKGMRTQWRDWNVGYTITGTALHHRVDTKGGQSGSPIYRSDHYLIGVHTGWPRSRRSGFSNWGAAVNPSRLSLMSDYARGNGWND